MPAWRAAPCLAAMRCWPVCCVVAIAGVVCTSPTAARSDTACAIITRGTHLNQGIERCIAFGGLRVDAAVSAELLRVLAPSGIESALHAIDARVADNSEVHRQAELAFTQARYEAGMARRQYDAIDPDNRLVAAELERRWNDRLVEVNGIEEQLAALATAKVVHWQAGDHTRLTVPKNRAAGRPRPKPASLSTLWRADSRTPASRPSQSLRQTHRQGQQLGPKARCALAPQRSWHCRVLGGRDDGMRRVDVRGGGAAPDLQQNDGAPADRQRRHPGAAGLQGRTLGFSQ